MWVAIADAVVRRQGGSMEVRANGVEVVQDRLQRAGVMCWVGDVRHPWVSRVVAVPPEQAGVLMREVFGVEALAVGGPAGDLLGPCGEGGSWAVERLAPYCAETDVDGVMVWLGCQTVDAVGQLVAEVQAEAEAIVARAEEEAARRTTEQLRAQRAQGGLSGAEIRTRRGGMLDRTLRVGGLDAVFRPSGDSVPTIRQSEQIRWNPLVVPCGRCGGTGWVTGWGGGGSDTVVVEECRLCCVMTVEQAVEAYALQQEREGRSGRRVWEDGRGWVWREGDTTRGVAELGALVEPESPEMDADEDAEGCGDCEGEGYLVESREDRQAVTIWACQQCDVMGSDEAATMYQRRQLRRGLPGVVWLDEETEQWRWRPGQPQWSSETVRLNEIPPYTLTDVLEAMGPQVALEEVVLEGDPETMRTQTVQAVGRWLGRRREQRAGDAGRRLREVERQVLEYQRELTQLQQRLEMYRAQVQYGKTVRDEAWVRREMEAIERIEGVSGVRWDSREGMLVVKVAPFEVSWKGAVYPLGPYEVYCRASDVRVRAVVNGTMVVTPLSSGYLHPHINTSGEPCLGNVKDSLAALYAVDELAAYMGVLMLFLKGYDGRDMFWTLEHWPVKGAGAVGTVGVMPEGVVLSVVESAGVGGAAGRSVEREPVVAGESGLGQTVREMIAEEAERDSGNVVRTNAF